MSTKKIREALEVLRMVDAAPAVYCEALQEVEAIERAAKAYVCFDNWYVDDESKRTLVTVAKDAP